jgi:flagellar hook-associated protein 3 FlgL
VAVTGDVSSGADALARISASHRSGELDKLNADLGNLAAAARTMRQVQGRVGARMNRLTGMETQSTTPRHSLTVTPSPTESVGVPTTSMDLQVQQAVYRAALGVTANVIQPSLVDFLR